MQNGKCFEVYTPDGALIGRLLLVEAGMPAKEEQRSVPASPKGKEKDQPGGATMTGPQKRLLFRLLATKGIEGDKTEAHLKKLFNVKELEEVSKFDASHLIERLIEEQGGNGDGSSL